MAIVETRDGRKLYYEEHGEGEPVLLLGGIMMSAASWVAHVPILSQHVRLILLDLRDQGQSEKATEPYLVEDHVSDVIDLLEELGVPSVHVLGLSYGGQVAQRVAVSHPARIRTLILANSNHFISNHLAEIGRAWQVAADLNDGERFFQLAVPFIYSRSFYEQYLEVLQQRQAIFKALLTKEWFDGFGRLCRSTEGFQTSQQELHDLSMPVLLIGASDDMITPERDMEAMQREISQCEFVSLPDAGHGAFLEKAGAFLTVIIGFLLKHSKMRSDEPS